MDISNNDNIKYYSASVYENTDDSHVIVIDETTQTPDYTNEEYINQYITKLRTPFNFANKEYQSITIAQQDYRALMNEYLVNLYGDLNCNIDEIMTALENNTGSDITERSLILKYINVRNNYNKEDIIELSNRIKDKYLN